MKVENRCSSKRPLFIDSFSLPKSQQMCYITKKSVCGRQSLQNIQGAIHNYVDKQGGGSGWDLRVNLMSTILRFILASWWASPKRQLKPKNYLWQTETILCIEIPVSSFNMASTQDTANNHISKMGDFITPLCFGRVLPPYHIPHRVGVGGPP